jgi:hypothetical protein
MSAPLLMGLLNLCIFFCESIREPSGCQAERCSPVRALANPAQVLLLFHESVGTGSGKIVFLKP